MRDHARPAPGGWPRPAAASPRLETPASRALALQGAVGNRAASRLLQRWELGDFKKIGDKPQYAAWQAFVAWSRSGAKELFIEPDWRAWARDYSAANSTDGNAIWAGFKRKPRFWVGGPLVYLAGSGTNAITLDDEVFFNPEAEWTDGVCKSLTYECTPGNYKRNEPLLDTYIHELVHVGQYGKLGIAGFLGVYTTQLLTKFIEGKLTKKDVQVFHEAGFEKAAYGVEERFKTWRRAREQAAAEAAKRPPAPVKDPLKEIGEQAERERRSGPARHGPVRISKSVGVGGRNEAADVKAVSDRLRALGYLETGTASVPAVTAAIKRYQQEVFGWLRPDGLIDPGGKTHAALAEGRRRSAMALPS